LPRVINIHVEYMLAATSVLFLIDLVFGVVEFFIGFRIILKLLGANPQAPFVSWVYETSRPLLAPFLGMFPSPRLQGRFLLEFSALFGLLVYGLIAYGISEIIRFVSFRAIGYTTKTQTSEAPRAKRGRPRR